MHIGYEFCSLFVGWCDLLEACKVGVMALIDAGQVYEETPLSQFRGFLFLSLMRVGAPSFSMNWRKQGCKRAKIGEKQAEPYSHSIIK